MVNPRRRRLFLCVSPLPSGIVIHMILIHFPFWMSSQNLWFFFLSQSRYQLGSSLTVCLKFLNNLYEWFRSIYIIFIWVVFGYVLEFQLFCFCTLLPDIFIEILRRILAAPIVAANLLTTIRVLSNLFSCSSFHEWLQVHCCEVRSKFFLTNYILSFQRIHVFGKKNMLY